MNNSLDENDTIYKTKKKKNTTSISVIKVHKETAKLLKQIVKNLNRKKKRGRKIIVDDVILRALSYLNEKDHAHIIEATLSNEDKFQIFFEQQKQLDPKLTEEKFYGEILKNNTCLNNSILSNPPMKNSNKGES